MSTVTGADEAMHPTGEDRAWSESDSFNFVDPKTGVGIFTRMGFRSGNGWADAPHAVSQVAPVERHSTSDPPHRQAGMAALAGPLRSPYPHAMTSDPTSSPRTRRAPPPEQDGRMARGRVTREKIVAALLDLIRAGNLSPTSDDVAQHAKVGGRTVFRHFQDMESLFEEMNAKVRSVMEPLLTRTSWEGALEQRIELLVTARTATFEQITPYYLSGETRLHASPTLQRARAQLAIQQRRQLLACLPEVGERPEVASAIELLTSMEGWLRLRRAQGLSVDQGRQAVVSAVRRLLTG